ncbi:MAG: hypothetical protein VX777_04685 [Chlamydiota bacterium]|nr:hypothetical protein [Chlamydiota bacterium]
MSQLKTNENTLQAQNFSNLVPRENALKAQILTKLTALVGKEDLNEQEELYCEINRIVISTETANKRSPLLQLPEKRSRVDAGIKLNASQAPLPHNPAAKRQKLSESEKRIQFLQSAKTKQLINKIHSGIPLRDLGFSSVDEAIKFVTLTGVLIFNAVGLGTIEDRHLEELSQKNPSLVRFDADCGITDNGILHLCHLKELMFLKLNFPHNIDSLDFTLLKQIKKLKHLFITPPDNSKKDLLNEIKEIKTLNTICLYINSNTTKKNLNKLQKFPLLNGVTFILKDVNNYEVINALEELPQLETFYICTLTPLPKPCIHHLKLPKSIKKLGFSKNAQVNEEDQAKLLQKYPNLEFKYL